MIEEYLCDPDVRVEGPLYKPDCPVSDGYLCEPVYKLSAYLWEPDCKISSHLFGYVYAEVYGNLWESDREVSVFNEQSLIVKRRGISVSMSQFIAMGVSL